jgi:hypothetical protein
MPRYKYESVHEWLYERCDECVRDGRADRLFNFLRPLIQEASADQLQDIYQSDMSEDGYFNDLDRPEGYRVHHDIDGWYVVEPDEEEPEDGYSLGFDGRPHYETEDEAWRAASEEATCHN